MMSWLYAVALRYEGMVEDDEGPVVDPREEFESADLRAQLRALIPTLPPVYREVLALCVVEELTCGEAARMAEVPEGTIRPRLHRVKAMLAERFAPAARRMVLWTNKEEERQRMAPPGMEAVLLGKLRRRRWARWIWWSAPLAVAAVAEPGAPKAVVKPAPFVAVGAWQAMEPIERGTIVWAQVPRATLATYGVPVGRGRLSESAPVKFLFGEDGTVRAMRVVSSIQ